MRIDEVSFSAVGTRIEFAIDTEVLSVMCRNRPNRRGLPIVSLRMPSSYDSHLLLILRVSKRVELDSNFANV